jgi:hypothetical protein
MCGQVLFARVSGFYDRFRKKGRLGRVGMRSAVEVVMLFVVLQASLAAHVMRHNKVFTVRGNSNWLDSENLL